MNGRCEYDPDTRFDPDAAAQRHPDLDLQKGKDSQPDHLRLCLPDPGMHGCHHRDVAGGRSSDMEPVYQDIRPRPSDADGGDRADAVHHLSVFHPPEKMDRAVLHRPDRIDAVGGADDPAGGIHPYAGRCARAADVRHLRRGRRIDRRIRERLHEELSPASP